MLPNSSMIANNNIIYQSTEFRITCLFYVQYTTHRSDQLLLPSLPSSTVIAANVVSYSVYIHEKQKHLRCKKGQGQEEPATKSSDINYGQELCEQIRDLKL